MERKSFALELLRERTGRDPEGLIRELYVERRHSQQEIADALGRYGVEVTRATVGLWIKGWGISRADRQAVAL